MKKISINNFFVLLNHKKHKELIFWAINIKFNNKKKTKQTKLKV